MTTPAAFDPVAYREREREDWNRVAQGWKKRWRTFERGASPLSDRMVELSRIGPGQRVLDVGTGIGEPALTAARLVGPTGRVVANDLSPRMLDIARERAAGLGLQNMDFVEADVEALNLSDGSFDAVLCRWALMFLPDPDGALRTLWRLLRPSGRLVLAVWGPPESVPLVSVTMDVLLPAIGLPPPPPDQPGMFRYADLGVLEKSLQQAGFRNLRAEPVTVTLEWPSPEAYTAFRQETAAVTVALLSRLPPAQREQILRAITEAAQTYAAPDGSIRMPNLSPCIVALR